MNPVTKVAAAVHGIFINKFAANNPRKQFTPEQREHLEKKESTRHNARQASLHSTGPTSPEGKRISSQNARKHGYAGATMVISDEDLPSYNAHLEGYIQAFQPQNQPQHDAVRLIANAMWRTDRLTTIETSLLELEIDWNSPFTDVHLYGIEQRHHIAIAFLQHTEHNTALDLCRRYLSGAQRDYQRAIASFEKLKQITVAVPIPEAEPEVKPEAPQTEPESVIQPDPEPAKPEQKLHLIQRDPNELPEITSSDRPDPSNKTANRNPNPAASSKTPPKAA